MQEPDTSAPLAGIDIGGTKIAALLVTDAGRVLARATVPAPAREGGAAMADAAQRSSGRWPTGAASPSARSAPVPRA